MPVLVVAGLASLPVSLQFYSDAAARMLVVAGPLWLFATLLTKLVLVAWPDLTLLISTLAIVATAMVVLWFLSLALRDASIADIFWGPGFAIVGWSSAAISETLVVAARYRRRPCHCLGTPVSRCTLLSRHHGEDSRYRAMRDRYRSARFPVVSLGLVFLFRDFCCGSYYLAHSGHMHLSAPRALGFTDVFGACLWLVSGCSSNHWPDLQAHALQTRSGQPPTRVMDQRTLALLEAPELLR